MTSDQLRTWFENRLEDVRKDENWADETDVRRKIIDEFNRVNAGNKRYLSPNWMDSSDGQQIIQRYTEQGKSYVKAQKIEQRVEGAKSLKQLRGISREGLMPEDEQRILDIQAEQRAELTAEKIAAELEYARGRKEAGVKISPSFFRQIVGQTYISQSEAQQILESEGLL